MRHPLVLPFALTLPLLLAGCPPGGASSDGTGEPSDAPSAAGPAELTLLFTSAGWGELGPCTCPNERLGGLARRAAVVSEARAAGAALALDAGDTVFATPTIQAGAGGEAARTRGRALLDALGAMGYAALAVGPKDLAAGPDWLRRAAAAAGVPLLSANLTTAPGAPAFDTHRIVEVAGRRVALVGLADAAADAAYRRAGLQVEPAVEAVQAVVAGLPPDTDRVVVLGAVTSGLARRVAEAVPEVDLLLTAGNGRLTRRAEAAGQALVYEAGVRGQHVLALDLTLSGPGPLDDTERRRSQAKAADALSERAAHLESRIAEAPEGRRHALERALETTRSQLARVRSGLARPTGGEVSARLVRLTLDRPRDPDVAARVDPLVDPPPPEGVCATGTCDTAG